MKNQYNLWGVSGGYITFLNDHRAVSLVIRYTGFFLFLLTGLSGYGQDTNETYGSGAGVSITTGHNNTLVGNGSGNRNTTGYRNVFFGASSGYYNISGNDNAYFGTSAGQWNTSGNHNVFIGVASGLENSGDNNTFLGRSSGRNSSGSRNVFLGNNAGIDEQGSDKLFIDNSGTSNPLIWGDFESDLVNINGNLGIGTSSPGFKLHIVGDASDDTHLLEIEGNNNAQSIISLSNLGKKIYLQVDGNGGHLNTRTEDPLIFDVYDQEKMRITVDGNVGIGTSSPSHKLHVNGNEILSTGTRAGFKFRNRGSTSSSDDWVWYSVDNIAKLWRNGSGDLMSILTNGNVGIGTNNPGSYKLAVEGKIGARGVDVKATSWADFVFDQGYALKPLTEVEAYIDQHHHLPDVPSEAEVTAEGIDVAEMLKIQMQKIEELTLYMIELKKENEELKEAMLH